MTSLINLALGFPHPLLYPIHHFSDAFLATGIVNSPHGANYLHNLSPPFSSDQCDDLVDIFSYADNLGCTTLRDELSDFLGRRHGLDVDPLSLMVYHGIAEQALFHISRLRASYGSVIVVEDPSYAWMPRGFMDIGMDVIGCPVDAEGIRLDVLSRILESNEVGFVYTIPHFQNPTTCSMSVERRRELVELSREFDFVVLSDEAYGELPFDSGMTCVPFCFDDVDCGQPEVRNRTRTNKNCGSVISMHSYSKTLFPGIRMGYSQIAPDSSLFDRIKEEKYGYYGGGYGALSSGNPILGHVVAEMYRSGVYGAWLEELREKYRRRCSLLCDALSEHQGDVFTFNRPEGGYFVWLDLGDTETQQEFVEGCLEENLNVMTGQSASILENGPVSSTGVRLCFGCLDEELLVEGGRICANVADRIIFGGKK